MKKILIFDDEGKIVDKWARGLETLLGRLKIKFEIEKFDHSEFWTEISILEERRKAARSRRREKPSETSRFDEIDVLVVDYDLLNLSQRDQKRVGSETAETVAYLCRYYSRCGLFVALNHYGKNPFDLTLKGHPESYADLNLGSDQLSNPGLWSDGWTGFRPWHWPLLPSARQAFANRAKALTDSLDKKILDYLRFPGDVVAALPRSAVEFLGPRKEPAEITFRDFVLESPYGLKRKDKALDDEAMARIAAARLAKWLERLVLSGQDILVDAPHLASRFPSLLTGDWRNAVVWNKTTSFKLTSLGLRTKKIEKFRFSRDDWLSRPAWFWKKLSSFEEIEEVKDPWRSRQESNLVFCEDVSQFLPEESAREFVADLPSSFVRRFVVNRNSAKKFDVERVQYTPVVRFAL